jgi:hypothetical protein
MRPSNFKDFDMNSLKSSTRSKFFLLFDVGLTVSLLALMSVALTGLALHEWLGIAFIAVLVLHLLLHWQWIAGATVRWLRSLSWQMRLTYLVDVVLFITMTLVIFSGLVISEAALPLMGLTTSRNFAWRAIHSATSNGVLLLISLHIALNWRWIVAVAQRMLPNLQPVNTASTILDSTTQVEV